MVTRSQIDQKNGMERIATVSAEIDSQLILSKVKRQFSRERTVFSTNDAGTIGYSYAIK